MRAPSEASTTPARRPPASTNAPPRSPTPYATDGAASPPSTSSFLDTRPEWAGATSCVEHHGQGLLERPANRVAVAGKRGGDSTLAACVVLSTTRVDVSGVVRRRLGAREASSASMDTATGETGMECGGVTPPGLPDGWPVLVDAAVVDLPYVPVGSGRRGKLLIPGKAFAELPGAVVLEELGVF